MLYQVYENPIIGNKTSDYWSPIDDKELEFYQANPIGEFSDSDMDSVILDSDSETDDFEYSNDEDVELPKFLGVGPTFPFPESTIFVEEVDSDSDLSKSEMEDFNFLNKPKKINSIPSSITIIELDSDSETDYEYDDDLKEFELKDNFTNHTTEESNYLNIGFESDYELDFQSNFEDQETEVYIDEENSKHLIAIVHRKEDLEGIKLDFEFHGHNFKEDDLNIKLQDKMNLVVKLNNIENKFERRFSLSDDCKLDKIKSKFSIWHRGGQTIQTLLITIPKEEIQQRSLTNSKNISIIEE